MAGTGARAGSGRRAQVFPGVGGPTPALRVQTPGPISIVMNEPTPGREIVPYDPESYAQDSKRVEDGFWDKVRKTLGRVPFVEEAVAAYFCATDRKTPLQVKAILIGALAYFVIPADMIPDFIAALGFTDDAAVFYAALRTVAPHIQPHHREQARQALEGLKADME